MEPPPFFSSEEHINNGHVNDDLASLPPPNVDTDSDHNENDNEAHDPAPDDNLDNTDMNFIAQQLQSADTKESLPPPFFSTDSSNDAPAESNAKSADTTPISQKSSKSQPLNASTTRGTPEPFPGAAGPPPPPMNIPSYKPLIKESKSIPIQSPPPAPFDSFDIKEPPLARQARNRVHSYNVPPPGGSSSRARNRKTSPPAPPKHHIPKLASEGNIANITLGATTFDHKNDRKQQHEFAIDQVSFTSILRQVDVGVEMTDRLKEVIRKFCKHQQMGADKLQEIYHKLPSTYVESDGMKGFAELCALVHQLILETVSAQKRLADFLFKDVVPKMDGYIKEKQQQVQQLKRDNQQAEMKLKNSINVMNKASNAAKNSASEAKKKARDAHSKGRKGSYNHDKIAGKKKKGKIGGLFNKFGNAQAHLPEDEQAYLKAQTNQLNYEATVMAANYEKDTYNKIQARFKRDCKGLEQQRLQYCQEKVQQVVNAHRSYFNNETIMVLQTRILSGLDTLDSRREFQEFLHRNIATHSAKVKATKTKYVATKYDYQNVFHSLQDSMDITHKLAPHAKLPLVLTSCCNKVRELNGFQTEGIFRKSAMATEIDRLKEKLTRNKYELDTKDPHVAACLLKDWLRGLKDSLIPQTHYDMALTMAKKGEVKAESLEVFLSQLPEVNRETIKYLVRFLKDLIVEENIGKTRMTIENVAIVFAPTILKCPHTDAKLLLANSRHEKEFTIELLNQLDTQKIKQ